MKDEEIKGWSDREIQEMIVNTIIEAGHDTMLLDVLCGAAEALGRPEVWYQACEALGYEPCMEK